MSANNRGKTKTGKSKTDLENARLSPGAHLRAEIQRLGLDQVAVSKATGVSRQSVNNIINGRQTISRAMAGKLGRLTGRSSDYWLSDGFLVTAGERAGRNSSARVTGVLVNHQIVRAIADGIIAIDPFAAQHLRAASINLTLDDVLVSTAGSRIKIGKKGFVLEPGRTVSAKTKERIELPHDYIGRIGAVSRLASRGILVTTAFQIEPGLRGCVDFCLFNAAGRALRLHALEPVLSLEIVRLAATPDGGPTT